MKSLARLLNTSCFLGGFYLFIIFIPKKLNVFYYLFFHKVSVVLAVCSAHLFQKQTYDHSQNPHTHPQFDWFSQYVLLTRHKHLDISFLTNDKSLVFHQDFLCFRLSNKTTFNMTFMIKVLNLFSSAVKKTFFILVKSKLFSPFGLIATNN